MPVTTRKKGGKWRVVEKATGKIAKNRAGTAIDGGGKTSKTAVIRQVAAVNSSLRRRKKKGKR